jgi:hypothetical protein
MVEPVGKPSFKMASCLTLRSLGALTTGSVFLEHTPLLGPGQASDLYPKEETHPRTKGPLTRKESGSKLKTKRFNRRIILSIAGILGFSPAIQAQENAATGSQSQSNLQQLIQALKDQNEVFVRKRSGPWTKLADRRSLLRKKFNPLKR